MVNDSQAIRKIRCLIKWRRYYLEMKNITVGGGLEDVVGSEVVESDVWEVEEISVVTSSGFRFLHSSNSV